jgi:nucleoside-diphosphate-sugar epimerase
MQTVGIIGGAGFIGSYVTKIFLEENYVVKVSSTDVSNKSKYEHLLTLMNAENLEMLPLDVMDKKALENFVQGCEIIVHSGTPFQLDVKDAQSELFDPTVTGTRNFLGAISKSKTVKKVVLIASIAAWNTSFPLNPATYDACHIFTEQDTPYRSEGDHPYAQAKFLADLEVRKFIDENPDLPFEITTICPTMVIGNSLSNRRDSTSIGLQYLIKNKIAPNPFVEMLFATDPMFSMVDVRDVAEAVYQAATTEGLHGKNYIIANESYKVSDISMMLNNLPSLHEAAFVYDSSLAKKDLGIAFIAAKETLNHCI